jgi:hypothetical protein
MSLNQNNNCIEENNFSNNYNDEVNKLKLKIKLDIKLREFILYSTKIKNLKILSNWLEKLEVKHICYKKSEYKLTDKFNKTNNFLQAFKHIMFIQNRQPYIDTFIENLKIFELDDEELIIDILDVIDIKNYN